MTDLSADQLKVVRSRVGDNPTDEELNERYDRLGTVDEVIRETLEYRLANLLDRPDSFTVPGEYSESRGGQIKALQDAIAEAGGGNSTVEVLSPPCPDPR